MPKKDKIKFGRRKILFYDPGDFVSLFSILMRISRYNSWKRGSILLYNFLTLICV